MRRGPTARLAAAVVVLAAVAPLIAEWMRSAAPTMAVCAALAVLLVSSLRRLWR